MDLEKVYIFLDKNKMSAEELFMLLTIYYRNSEESINNYAVRYYNADFQKYTIEGVIHTIQYKSIVDKLIDRGLVEDLRNERDKKDISIKLSKLKVSKDFIDMYFVQQDSAYEIALSLYPDFTLYDSNNNKHATKSINHTHYRKLFYNQVIKGGDKEEFDFFCYMTKEIFDYTPIYDADYNEIGGSPSLSAITKFDKYLDTFEALKKDFKLQNNIV